MTENAKLDEEVILGLSPFSVKSCADSLEETSEKIKEEWRHFKIEVPAFLHKRLGKQLNYRMQRLSVHNLKSKFISQPHLVERLRFHKKIKVRVIASILALILSPLALMLPAISIWPPLFLAFLLTMDRQVFHCQIVNVKQSKKKLFNRVAFIETDCGVRYLISAHQLEHFDREQKVSLSAPKLFRIAFNLTNNLVNDVSGPRYDPVADNKKQTEQ